VTVATDMGVDFDTVLYLKTRLDEETLRGIIAKLEDPVENMVRKDSQFKKLGLNEEDYVGNADAVIEILVRYPRLLQRPIVVTDDKAIIGRPLGDEKAKDRLAKIFA